MFIYIHLPFCLSHCIYCDFYVELKATPDRRSNYLRALRQEIALALRDKQNDPIQTVYFGGGTPALFTAEEISSILACLKTYADLAPDAEITLEANPEAMASPPLEYQTAGINRFSVGVQSLQPNELKRLSRVHSREQVFRCLEQMSEAGITNISVDLMYGIPEQTLESWQNTLAQVSKLPVTHISMYGLKVEEGTGLAKLVEQGRTHIPIDDMTVEMYFEGVQFLEQQGFHQYEISNYAKPGYESLHNLCYWDNQEFWGFGVSAHGYIDSIRYENPRDLQTYLATPGERAETHFCTPQEKLENAMIFGLRKRAGVCIPALESQFHFNFDTRYVSSLSRFFEAGLLIRQGDMLALAPDAIPISNEILATFLET